MDPSNRVLPRVVCALATVCSFAGCQYEPRWRTVTHDASFDELWGQLVLLGDRAGYPIDFSDSDRGRRKFVSRWREQPAPFKMGARTRLNAEFERVEDQPGWVLRFHIQKQGVSDIGVGFDPADEDWEDVGQDFQREEFLLGQLRLAFGQGLGLEPQRLTGR